MEKIYYDDDNFALRAPDSLKIITDDLIKVLNERISFYKLLFNVSSFRKVQINYFDDIEKFREFIYDIRKENKSLPKYAKGTFDGGMINSYANLKDTTLEKIIYRTSHELFHIMYKEIVWQGNYDRIIWFDEGMAQFFSGENDKLKDDNSFYNWFNDVIKNTKVIPKLNELKHNYNFETNEYSGYRLSYLAVKYLFKVLGYENFKSLIINNDKILKYGDTILEEAINYYKERVNNFDKSKK